MRAVMLDSRPLDAGGLDLGPIRDAVDSLTTYETTAPDAVVDRMAGHDIVLVNKVALGREALEAVASSVRLICLLATGTDNVDLEAARALGITVCNCRAYGTPAVTQHVFALLLSLFTQVHRYDADVRGGKWAASPTFCFLDYPIRELSGKRLGIVGYGELGQSVASVARAFGMEVLLAARPDGAEDDREGRVPLDGLLAQVDALSLHCPLTPATRHMINASCLERMQAHAVLINTARGALVDSTALAGALRAGRISGAGIDVLEQEPPRDGDPLLAPDIPNLIVTPHSAWGSVEARRRMVDQLAGNIRGFREGKPVRVVV